VERGTHVGTRRNSSYQFRGFVIRSGSGDLSRDRDAAAKAAESQPSRSYRNLPVITAGCCAGSLAAFLRPEKSAPVVGRHAVGNADEVAFAFDNNVALDRDCLINQ
jgi:hypothetical protein